MASVFKTPILHMGQVNAIYLKLKNRKPTGAVLSADDIKERDKLLTNYPLLAEYVIKKKMYEKAGLTEPSQITVEFYKDKSLKTLAGRVSPTERTNLLQYEHEYTPFVAPTTTENNTEVPPILSTTTTNTVIISNEPSAEDDYELPSNIIGVPITVKGIRFIGITLGKTTYLYREKTRVYSGVYHPDDLIKIDTDPEPPKRKDVVGYKIPAVEMNTIVANTKKSSEAIARVEKEGITIKIVSDTEMRKKGYQLTEFADSDIEYWYSPSQNMVFTREGKLYGFYDSDDKFHKI